MNDQELKLALCGMLPAMLYEIEMTSGSIVRWNDTVNRNHETVKRTEWLHICWLVEQGLSYEQQGEYRYQLLQLGSYECLRASWQQRATALIKVKETTK